MVQHLQIEKTQELALFANSSASQAGIKSFPGPSLIPPVQTETLAEACLEPIIGERWLDVYERALNPEDPMELRDLFIGRIEAELSAETLRPELARRWRASRRLRTINEAQVLNSKTTVRFVKELFNWFFRDDLYGLLRLDNNIILSSGSVNESVFGLPSILKDCIRYALDRDWYGYSDSRGREATREAIAAFENARVEGSPYTRENVAVTLGGTSAFNAIVDFIALSGKGTGSPALCATPSYPPLVESIARRFPISLVPLSCGEGQTDLTPLINALRPDTPLVLLQTVTNPTGTRVAEEDLKRLIEAASPSTLIVLDECHECLGPIQTMGRARANTNVVRVASLSKSLSAPGLKLGWIVADDHFIEEYYEYASTSYGSPPSIFYLLLEVMARFERWRLEGREAIGPIQLREFEATYGLTVESLQAAYLSYLGHRYQREQSLYARRDETVRRITEAGLGVVTPLYSLNVLMSAPASDDDYRYFRETLAATGVSLYPGILNFCFHGSWMRFSPCVAPEDFQEAFSRLEDYWSRRAEAHAGLLLSGQRA